MSILMLLAGLMADVPFPDQVDGLDLLAWAPGDEYEPDTSVVPPDLKNGVQKLLGLASWTVTGVCVAGVFIVAGKAALSHQRGEGSEHATGLGWVGFACVLVGTASALVGALT